MNLILKKLRFKSILNLLLILCIVNGCSWLKNRKSLFNEEDKDVAEERKEKEIKSKVSKTQYNQLLKKYEKLNDKFQAARDGKKAPDSRTGKLMNELSSVKVKRELEETVNVFGKNGLVSKRVVNRSNPMQISVDVDKRKVTTDKGLNSEIKQLRKGINDLYAGRNDSAMKIFKYLEGSNNRQVRVRAKFYIGELLFTQKEYDLALQIFEDIIQKEAFSGMVLSTLGRLVICTEKLGITKKQERYYSILHDFFEG